VLHQAATPVHEEIAMSPLKHAGQHVMQGELAPALHDTQST
jgi:hypothetical protein